jgi:hypothetical protein
MLESDTNILEDLAASIFKVTRAARLISYNTTGGHIPEYLNLNLHIHENLKSPTKNLFAERNSRH